MNYVKGDILSIEKGVIVHQVNAMGKMGAGIAKKIVTNFPEHLKDYKKMIKQYPSIESRLGKVVVTNLGDIVIVGIVGQLDYGNSNVTKKCYTNYESLNAGFEKVGKMFNYTNKKIYIPEFIGCGLAGGAPDKTHEMIKTNIRNPYIVEFKKGEKIEQNKDLIIVDGMNLIHRSYYANQDHNGGVAGFIRYINRYLLNFSVDNLLVCLDGDNDTFRKEIYPDYKANRNNKEDELKHQFELVKEYLQKANIQYVVGDKYEADDLVGTLAYKGKELGYDVLIVSGDSDLKQLIDNDISMLYIHVHGDKIINKDDIIEENDGLNPKALIDLKALAGDSADNIPGVKGIGKKTALKLLKKYKDLDGIYEDIDNITGKRKENLINEKELVYLFKDLNTIRTNINMDFSIISENKIEVMNDSLLDFFNRENIELKDVGLSEEINRRKENEKTYEKIKDRILSSNAMVLVFNKKASIRNHYYGAYCFDDNNRTTHIEINGKKLDKNLITDFYNLLWCKYLDMNQDLVDKIRNNKELLSNIKKDFPERKHYIIEHYVNGNREQIIEESKELIYALK